MITTRGSTNFGFFLSLSFVLWAIFAIQIAASQNHYMAQEGGPNPSPTPTPVESDETIRIESNLVTFPVVVTDHQGRNIIDLKKEDFVVLENDVEQEISLFDSVNEPVTILLLLDVSGSMGYRLTDLADAANVFVGRLRPNDSLIAATFADNVSVLFGPKRVASLGSGLKIKSHYGSSSTMLFDAVDTALRKMRKIKGRKAIVLFSDGMGSGKFASSDENLRLAEEGETMVYTVQFKTVFTEPDDEKEKKKQQKILDNADLYMQDLAKKPEVWRFN